MRLPLKDLQKEINKSLKNILINSKNIDVYDKVEQNAKLPFIKLFDLSFNADSTKSNSRVIINQKIEIWSDYQGKKEAIEILESVINEIKKLEEMDLNEEQYIFDVKIIEGNIIEVQEFYKGYISIDFIID